tara:strand:+ start:446 stop:751 length:306 start_codon:yes stop_codon:yes gene_type:complete
MEVVEIISHFISKESNIIRVEFKCINDEFDKVRTDTIEYDKLKEYGYDDSINFNDFSGDFEEDEWESEYDEDEFSIDGDVLLEFLREYYLVEGNLPGEEYL